MNSTVRFYDTAGASRFCGERGLPVASTTLNKLRCVGGGPRFFRFGRKVAYSEPALLNWLSGRLGPEVASTSAPMVW
jgi:hypothetical protein